MMLLALAGATVFGSHVDVRARGKGGDFCAVGVGRTGKGGVRECLEQVSSQLGLSPPPYFFPLRIFISHVFH